MGRLFITLKALGRATRLDPNLALNCTGEFSHETSLFRVAAHLDAKMDALQAAEEGLAPPRYHPGV